MERMGKQRYSNSGRESHFTAQCLLVKLKNNKAQEKLEMNQKGKADCLQRNGHILEHRRNNPSWSNMKLGTSFEMELFLG
jgi:hypothetical protein